MKFEINLRKKKLESVKVRVKERKERIFKRIHYDVKTGKPLKGIIIGSYNCFDKDITQEKPKFDPETMRKSYDLVWEAENGITFETSESLTWENKDQLKKRLREEYDRAFLIDKSDKMKAVYVDKKVWIEI